MPNALRCPSWFIVALSVMGGLLLMPSLPVWAQETPSDEREATEERLESLREQIERDQQRLQRTEREAADTRERLEELNREIALRQELVDTYERRLNELQAQQSSARDTLQQLDRERAALLEEYKARATHAYRYGRLHDLALVFSSNSINQMIVRVRYLRQFADQRRSRRDAIQEAQASIEEQQSDLQASQARTQELLVEARSERNQLQNLHRDRRSVVEELQAEQADLRDEIEETRASVEELEQRIQEMMAEATAEGDAEEAGGARVLSEAAYAELSTSFAENRGQLPWPVDGAITETYGDHVDPVHGTTTNTPGITIATNPGAPVYSVFDGTVSGVDFVPGFGTLLMVRHGDYLSVYSNLSDLDVSMGDSIAAGDQIGQAGTDSEPRGAGLFFAIFDMDASSSDNPTHWLRSR